MRLPHDTVRIHRYMDAQGIHHVTFTYGWAEPGFNYKRIHGTKIETEGLIKDRLQWFKQIEELTGVKTNIVYT